MSKHYEANAKQMLNKMKQLLNTLSKISTRKDKIRYIAYAYSLIKRGYKQISFLKENFVKEKVLKPAFSPVKSSISLLKSCGKSFQQVFNNSTNFNQEACYEG